MMLWKLEPRDPIRPTMYKENAEEAVDVSTLTDAFHVVKNSLH